MSYITDKEHRLIQQAIFIPMLIHILENDRKRVSESNQVLKSYYISWIDQLLKLIHLDSRQVKRTCYRENIIIAFKERHTDLLIYHCRAHHYTFEESFTISAVKWHLQTLLKHYIGKQHPFNDKHSPNEKSLL